MDNFEDIGKRLDEELTRIRAYVEKEIAPEAEKRSAQVLREIAEKAAQVTEKLEARISARVNKANPDAKP